MVDSGRCDQSDMIGVKALPHILDINTLSEVGVGVIK